MKRAIFVIAAACATEPVTEPPVSILEQDLDATTTRERAMLIRDSAAEMGVYNAALFAGIAISETNFAHCHSEATWACPGPASPSCGGGPIIAGSADGPCADQQGGLGMFQFDSGTYAQTLATYGDSILTVEGNTAQAVDFVVERAIQSVDGVSDWMSAVDYMNGVPMNASDPDAQAWGRFMACRYNGCCSTSSLCTSRATGYRDNAIDIFNELGAEFWATKDRCTSLPAGGVIDQRSECYLAGGDPRYWHREATGQGDDHEWTGSTAAAAPSNFARWFVRPGAPIMARVEAYIAGSNATAANYVIVHAGGSDTVAIDQTMQSGWVDLGMFDFSGDGSEYVELGDNTGIADQNLVFDAVRVTDPNHPPDPNDPDPNDPDPTDPPSAGGCSTGGGGLGFGLLFALCVLVRSSSRRR